MDAVYSLTLSGAMAKAGTLVMANYLKETPFDKLVEVFRKREEWEGAWRCEFWGKILRGAILLNQFLQDPEMEKIVDETVEDLLSCQTPDGCISSYPEEMRLEKWDIWGMKYVLIGLLRYAETGKRRKEIGKAASRLLLYIEKNMEKAGKNFPDYGAHGGLPSSSILGAVAGVWRLTGDPHWKSLAEKIIKSGCSRDNHIFEEVEKGTLPANIGNGKAYELTSCFQGLAEYILAAEDLGEEILADRDYRKIVFQYFSSVFEKELMITGTAGLKDSVGEFWNNGAEKQHLSNAGSLGETCIMTTLLHFADKLLSLAGEMHFEAVEMAEKILYNGLLGAMTPDGRNFTHANPTPLTGGGCKIPAPDQMQLCFGKPFYGNDCCRAQGPEGLAMAYRLAVRPLVRNEENSSRITGCVINFYEKMRAAFPEAEFSLEGNWPYENKVEIRATSREEFMLALRIPHYIQKVCLNGEALSIKKGFLLLQRKWEKSDLLEITLDLSLKEIPLPGDPGFFAIARGPVILAEDSRMENVPGAVIHENWNGHSLVEYSAAGNLFTKENPIRVIFQK